MTLKFDRWPWKIIGHLFYATSSFVYHCIAICEFKLELQSGNPQFGSKSRFCFLCDLEIWWMTLKNNRAPLLSNIKLCASFRHHIWIQTRVTVQKWLSWVLTSVILTFDLWAWLLAWILLLSFVITPENFIQWREHYEKCVTDGRTDGQMERSVLGAAWSQLKCNLLCLCKSCYTQHKSCWNRIQLLSTWHSKWHWYDCLPYDMNFSQVAKPCDAYNMWIPWVVTSITKWIFHEVQHPWSRAPGLVTGIGMTEFERDYRGMTCSCVWAKWPLIYWWQFKCFDMKRCFDYHFTEVCFLVSN